MPIAIALLNGNTAPRAGALLSRSRSCDSRERGADGCAARSARPPRRIRHRNRARRDRRRGFPCSARAGRIPARATARWHRSFARRGWPAPRRGRDRRRRRRYRESRACPARCGGVLSGPRRGAPVRSRVGGSCGSCIGTCGWRRRADGGGGASARRLRGCWRGSSLPERRTIVARGRRRGGRGRSAAEGGACRRLRRRRLRPAAPALRRPRGGTGIGAEGIAGAGAAAGARSYRRRRRARPRGRAGRPRIRPCARPLPATAARG